MNRAALRLAMPLAMNSPRPVPLRPFAAGSSKRAKGSNSRLAIGGNADARILDLNLDLPVAGARSNGHLPTPGRILDGV